MPRRGRPAKSVTHVRRIIAGLGDLEPNRAALAVIAEKLAAVADQAEANHEPRVLLAALKELRATLLALLASEATDDDERPAGTDVDAELAALMGAGPSVGDAAHG